MENLVNGNFDVHIQLFAIVAALLSWRYGQGFQASYKEIRWLHCAGALRETRVCLFVRLKCAVSPVCVFLTNALRSHYACGLECGGIINARYEPH